METKSVSPVGEDWGNLRDELLTKDERATTDLKIALLNEIINVRQDCGLTQKELEAASGVRQPIIARLECGKTDPQLSTVIKLLASLGKTLAIVPISTK